MDEKLERRAGPERQTEMPKGCCQLCGQEVVGWALNATFEERERCECRGRIIVSNLCWTDC